MGNVNTNKKNREWHEYPVGTKVYASGGGYWERTKSGYKWCNGSTFNTPGGDWFSIEIPETETAN